MSLSQNPTIIAALMQRLQSEMSRIEELRAKNRQFSILIVGAVIGFVIREMIVANVILIGIAGLIVALMFWIQNYQLHRYRTAWNCVDQRIRKFIRGEIDEVEVRLMEYDDNDEKKTNFFAVSSSFTFVILIFGTVLSVFYKLILF
jgi:hypothetical protein